MGFGVRLFRALERSARLFSASARELTTGAWQLLTSCLLRQGLAAKVGVQGRKLKSGKRALQSPAR
ncbi:MAG: hypothetical protein AAF851_22760, partial [Myxococcota bacterium]